MTPIEALICGIDEAGRGPLCGNVVAAAVILDPARPIAGLNDSKKLSERAREALAERIRADALAWAIGEATPAEIDRLNILHATMLAMQRAAANLPAHIRPLEARIDGNRCPELPWPTRAIVKGDASDPAIAAASILAKTTRDAQLRALAAAHPHYGFARHKGYPTAEHLAALRRLGPLPCHRRSFRPVREACPETDLLSAADKPY